MTKKNFPKPETEPEKIDGWRVDENGMPIMFDLHDHVCRAMAGGTILLRLDGALEPDPSPDAAGAAAPSCRRTTIQSPPAQFRLTAEQARRLATSLVESAVAILEAGAQASPATPSSTHSRTRRH